MSLSFQPGAEAGKNQDANLGLGFETQASHNQPVAAKAPLPVREFTYTEVAKPPSESKAILGPAVRLFATFITLGFSEDIHKGVKGIHKEVKKKLVATLSDVITAERVTKEERQKHVEAFKADPDNENKTNPHYEKAEKLSVSVGDKATLDGILIKPEPEPSGGAQKYVIWLNGLNQPYEEKLSEAGKYADTAEANILMFNYRGCGDSTSNGSVQPKDLITDTLAMIAYLTDKGVKPEDIVIHGYSLGGGVGAAAAAQAGTRHINDRSFSTFSKAIKENVAAILTEKVGKTAANVIGSLTASLIRGYDLDLNTSKAYQKLEKDTLILHHPDDARINKSSLKSFLYKHHVTAENRGTGNHQFVNLAEGSDIKENIHAHHFMNFEGTAQRVAEFIHNKPFAEIHPATARTDVVSTTVDKVDVDENADLMDFLDNDGKNAGEGVLNFAPEYNARRFPDATNSRNPDLLAFKSPDPTSDTTKS